MAMTGKGGLLGQAAPPDFRDSLANQQLNQRMHDMMNAGAQQAAMRQAMDAQRYELEAKRHELDIRDRYRYRPNMDRIIEAANRFYARHSPEWNLFIDMAQDPRNEGMDIHSMASDEMFKRRERAEADKLDIDRAPDVLTYLRTHHKKFTHGVKLR